MDFNFLLEKCAREKMRIRSDSRLVEKGDIFVAVPGENQDGGQFVAQAAERGASCIVCRPEAAQNLRGESFPNVDLSLHEEPRAALWRLAQSRWNTASLPLKVLAVTGTNGKTTSAFLLEALFAAAGKKVGVLGTITYHWPGFSMPAPLTTPDPLSLHEMLARMAEAGVEIVVMEVSSHALAQQRVGGIPFSGALFTNLTQDHLDFHKTMENYFQAKSKLFLELPLASKAMAINSDDGHGRRLLESLPEAVAFGFGQEFPNRRNLRGKILEHGPGGMLLEMRHGPDQWLLRTPLVGGFNAFNLLGIQALGLELGLKPRAFAALENFHGVCGRLERVKNKLGLHVFVDYAHTPDALVKALEALRGAGFKRIVTVFGCGGNRDRSKRPLMGAAVARYSDVAILTSDNPRFEEPEAIIADVLPGLAKAAEVVVEVDRRKATARGLEILGPEDALLIAGKGHEDYQLIKGEKFHYSDQEVARELINCA